ncbi:MAG: hypothetical protein DWP97_11715 [Calditrichaeota bacterium]|nr:MAG: hypothetical protein DWP97_11715 [Calditrichota bacterium]
MPCLEISMPEVDRQTKEKLTDALTTVFAQTTKFGAEIFGIRFHEYKEGQSASGGNVWDGRSGRPYLHMLLYIPRINRETKQKLVARFTDAMIETVGKESWMPVIHICEHPYDNVGVEGKLLSDSYEACAKSKFYYDVGDEQA